MNVAILFGAFDPPHLGHYLIASQVKEKLPIDQVWLMPDFSHPFNKKLSPPFIRLKMVSFYQEKEKIIASDYSIKRKKVSYTYDILNELSLLYPQTNFFAIIGSDNLENFSQWKEWQKLIKEKNLIIFPRDTEVSTLKQRVKKAMQLKKIPKNIIVLDNKELIITNISSTKIRERIKKRLPISYLVNKKTEEFIFEYNLYQQK